LRGPFAAAVGQLVGRLEYSVEGRFRGEVATLIRRCQVNCVSGLYSQGDPISKQNHKVV